MITTISKNIRIWQEFNPIELALGDSLLNAFDSKRVLGKLGFDRQRVGIKSRWFDVITPSELVRKRNKNDGYYRVIYIQINMESGEYYIGKCTIQK